MKNLSEFYDKDYYERGPETGKSLYSLYRWIPELTIPLAHHISVLLDMKPTESVLDYGCAKGYLLKAFKLLGHKTVAGVELSDYAIQNADPDVRNCISDLNQFVKNVHSGVTYDHIICKDVLEHINEEYLDDLLKYYFYKICKKRLFILVPLGENDKYIIPEYEKDKSHILRKNREWWESKIEQAGFKLSFSTCDVEYFKMNWESLHPEGNLIIIADKDI
jgi:cyclopropane fatty-acyl-phospholipid synthase-like methyltransferase